MSKYCTSDILRDTLFFASEWYFFLTKHVKKICTNEFLNGSPILAAQNREPIPLHATATKKINLSNGHISTVLSLFLTACMLQKNLHNWNISHGTAFKLLFNFPSLSHSFEEKSRSACKLSSASPPFLKRRKHRRLGLSYSLSSDAVFPGAFAQRDPKVGRFCWHKRPNTFLVHSIHKIIL